MLNGYKIFHIYTCIFLLAYKKAGDAEEMNGIFIASNLWQNLGSLSFLVH